LQPPVPLWRQIADHLRREILSGRYPAGQPLPSEEVLAGEFGVSRPTIRQGIATLASEGLVTVRRPYGTTVRDPHAPPAAVEHRTLRLTGTTYTEPESPGYDDVGVPVHVRVDATVALAALLDVPPGQPLATREVLQQAPDGQRRALRLYMPFAVAAESHGAPWATDGRLPTPVDLYTWLAEHGHRLHFTERVRARMPVGDETQALHAGPGVPLLIITRITHDDSRPLAVEEIRTPADVTEPAYPLPVTKAPTPRKPTKPTTTGR